MNRNDEHYMTGMVSVVTIGTHFVFEHNQTSFICCCLTSASAVHGRVQNKMQDGKPMVVSN